MTVSVPVIAPSVARRRVESIDDGEGDVVHGALPRIDVDGLSFAQPGQRRRWDVDRLRSITCHTIAATRPAQARRGDTSSSRGNSTSTQTTNDMAPPKDARSWVLIIISPGPLFCDR